jgi:hypothetical protein
MKYQAPLIDGKPYYIPVVVKSRDYLIGFLHSKLTFESLMAGVLEKVGIQSNFSMFENCLDSTRFNDVLQNGKRISECSGEEFDKYIQNVVEEKVDKIQNNHPDNILSDDVILKLECSCGLGFESYTTVESIPKESVKCKFCDKILLHYTDHYDTEYEFDKKE